MEVFNKQDVASWKKSETDVYNIELGTIFLAGFAVGATLVMVVLAFV